MSPLCFAFSLYNDTISSPHAHTFYRINASLITTPQHSHTLSSASLKSSLSSPVVLFPRSIDHTNSSRRNTILRMNSDEIQQKRSSISASEERDIKARKFVAVLAALGAAETLFLTLSKIFQPSLPGLLCHSDSCLNVLNGPYSSFLGVPLSAFGTLFYISYLIMALLPFVTSASSSSAFSSLSSSPSFTKFFCFDKIQNKTLNEYTKLALLAISTSMMSFSLYLVYLMRFVLNSFCPWCYLSAILSLVIFLTTVFGLPSEQKIVTTTSGHDEASTPNAEATTKSTAKSESTPSTTQNLPSRVISRRPELTIPGTLITTLLICFIQFATTPYLINTEAGAHAIITTSDGRFAPPEITEHSSPRAIKMIKDLQKVAGKDKIKMYGAYWCSHCFNQKQMFGKEAFAMVEYIECAKNGVNSKNDLCKANDIPGYPVWEIAGEYYYGEQSWEDFENILKIPPVSKDPTTKQERP